MVDRRTFLCGLAALPFLGGSVAILGQPTAAAAMPLAFDPAAFLAELTEAGYGVTAYRSIPRGGENISTPSYFIRPPEGRGFGNDYLAIMARWADAVRACPEHVESVVAEVFERHRVARVMRAALGLALMALWLLWWLPTIALALACLAWRHVWFDLRMARVRRLREAGRLDAAQAELDRIQRDFGAAP